VTRFLARAKRRKGTAAVEFAVVLPFLLLMLGGIWEIGRVLNVTQALENAAREGGRAAAVGSIMDPQTGAASNVTADGKTTNLDVQTTVKTYLAARGYNTSNVTVTFQDWSRDPTTNLPGTQNTAVTEPYQAGKLDYIKVQVSIPYRDITWEALNLFLAANTQITVTVWWCMVDDSPFTVKPASKL